jgi:hypothetical protein
MPEPNLAIQLAVADVCQEHKDNAIARMIAVDNECAAIEEIVEGFPQAPIYPSYYRDFSREEVKEQLGRIDRECEAALKEGDKETLEIRQNLQSTRKILLVPCLRCGRLGWRYPSQLNKNHYCSEGCKVAAVTARKTRYCPVCNAKFYVTNRTNQKFCSAYCSCTATTAYTGYYKLVVQKCQQKFGASFKNTPEFQSAVLTHLSSLATKTWQYESIESCRLPIPDRCSPEMIVTGTCAICGQHYQELNVSGPDIKFCRECEDLMNKSVKELFPTMEQLYNSRHDGVSPKPKQIKLLPIGKGLEGMKELAESSYLMAWKKKPVQRWTREDLYHWISATCVEKRILMDTRNERFRWLFKYLMMYEDNGDGTRGISMVYIVEILSNLFAHYKYFVTFLKWRTPDFDFGRLMSYWTVIKCQMTRGKYAFSLRGNKSYLEREAQAASSKFRPNSPPSLLPDPPPVRRNGRLRITDWRNLPEEKWHLHTVWQFMMEYLRSHHVDCKDFKKSHYRDLALISAPIEEVIGVAKWVVLNFDAMAKAGNWTIPFSLTSFAHLYPHLQKFWKDRTKGKNYEMKDLLVGLIKQADPEVSQEVGEGCRVSAWLGNKLI